MTQQPAAPGAAGNADGFGRQQSGIGLNTGPILIGAVGKDLKYEYTAMGDTVNLAALLQSTASAMTALLTEHSYRFIAPLFECALTEPLAVKGLAEPLQVYALHDAKIAPGQVRGLAGERVAG